MAKNQTIIFKNPPIICGTYTISGPKEGKGPFGKYFDRVLKCDKFDEKTYEKSECKMMQTAILSAVENCGLKEDQIELLICGDLLNQTVSSSFSARSLGIPLFGIYSACSTMSQGIALAACLISGGTHSLVAVATGSHFSAAERQYRFPLEFGAQRPVISQWTATGCAALVLKQADAKQSGTKVVSATFGTVIDLGVKDVNNMGAAMAPAAAETFLTHLKNTQSKPDDYCAILTGDLGKLGSEIFIDLCGQEGVKIGNNYSDCGQMLFDKYQNTNMGGSGCGCSALIVSSIVLNKLKDKKYKRVLYLATGALLSPTTSFQGESIPGICHAVEFFCK